LLALCSVGIEAIFKRSHGLIVPHRASSVNRPTWLLSPWL
jgi:hypothetical protein